MEGSLNLRPSIRGNICISTLYEKRGKIPRMIMEESGLVGAYPMMQAYGEPEEQERPSNEVRMFLITPHFLSHSDLKWFEFLVWFHNKNGQRGRIRTPNLRRVNSILFSDFVSVYIHWGMHPPPSASTYSL
jgi:hypothetical protein